MPLAGKLVAAQLVKEPPAFEADIHRLIDAFVLRVRGARRVAGPALQGRHDPHRSLPVGPGGCPAHLCDLQDCVAGTKLLLHPSGRLRALGPRTVGQHCALAAPRPFRRSHLRHRATPQTVPLNVPTWDYLQLLYSAALNRLADPSPFLKWREPPAPKAPTAAAEQAAPSRPGFKGSSLLIMGGGIRQSSYGGAAARPANNATAAAAAARGRHPLGGPAATPPPGTSSAAAVATVGVSDGGTGEAVVAQLGEAAAAELGLSAQGLMEMEVRAGATAGRSVLSRLHAPRPAAQDRCKTQLRNAAQGAVWLPPQIGDLLHEALELLEAEGHDLGVASGPGPAAPAAQGPTAPSGLPAQAAQAPLAQGPRGLVAAAADPADPGAAALALQPALAGSAGRAAEIGREPGGGAGEEGPR
jgi:hypothetical protein